MSLNFGRNVIRLKRTCNIKPRVPFKYVNETWEFLRLKQHNRGYFDSELSSPHVGPIMRVG